ncbi:MAG: hypothetical protein H7326_12235 [Bdellovibrionaceae bacterium]|nr:hypothetical protein [Pseudobdellovibrionaceae bacterium]
MRILMLLVLYFMVMACNKPNPNPELSDEIYSDLSSNAEAAKKDVESEKKKLEGFKKDLGAVVPQSGKIKYAQKRFFESGANLARLEQQAKFFELKAQARLKYTKLEYLKAFKDGKPWPTPEELESYKTYNLMSKKDPSWDSRKRVQAYEKENGIVSAVKPKAEGGKKAEIKTTEK